jgi:hypothetical protein
MLIQCTKKLFEQMGMKPTSQAEEEPLFSWHANLMTINRRKAVVLVNDQNRYVVVLYGLKAKDFSKINELMIQGIREAFLKQGITDEVIEKYLQKSQGVIFMKTKDRTSVARMNKACENVEYFADRLDPETIYNTELSLFVSSLLVGDGKKSYLYPNVEMFKNLEEFAGQSIFSMRAVQLKVTLKLEEQLVWRRIVLPLHWTFPQLHEVLQTAFAWQDSHLHEFTILDEVKSSRGQVKHRPIMNLVMNEESFHFPSKVEKRFETGIKLSEYLPAHGMLSYTYDLGDDWEHVIEVEKTIEDYDAPHPKCLDGEGDSPPEDVGGSHGYTEFLKILANPNHEDYQSMLDWGRMQGFKVFDLDQINRLLK